MSNFFKANFFATEYFEGDQYWRPKVPVPVPVAVPVGGGGGIWPVWRMRAECEEWAKEHAAEICKKKWKKLKKLDPFEAIKKKEAVSKEEKKNRVIRRLTKELEKLRAELKAAKGAIEEARKDSEAGLQERRRLRRRIRFLRRLLLGLHRRIRKLEKEKGATPPEVRPAPAPAEPPPPPPTHPPAALPAAPPSPPPFLAQAIAAHEEVKDRILSALPWAIGAGGVYLGTRYLVPEDRRWLKFLGYAGTGVLAVVAIVKLAGIDFSLGTAAKESPADGVLSYA